jgi:hypothetical protein
MIELSLKRIWRDIPLRFRWECRDILASIAKYGQLAAVRKSDRIATNPSMTIRFLERIDSIHRDRRRRAWSLLVPSSQIQETLPRKRVSFVGQRPDRHGALLTKFVGHAGPRRNKTNYAIGI